MHYLKINKGIWLQKGNEDILQLSNDFYLNLDALTSFCYYRLETDLTVFNTNRVLKKWENYILELSLPGHEVFKFIIHVTDDLLLQKIELLMDAIDLKIVASVNPVLSVATF